MKESAKQNVTLGVFIVIGFLLLVGLIYFLGSQKSLFGSKVEISVLFKTVSGLQPGANVRFSGLNIGTVKEVAIANDSLVRVSLVIDQEAAGYVKQDAFATVESDGLMGNQIISISGGTSGDHIHDGDQINSKEPLSLDDIMNSFKNASDNAGKLTQNLKDISDQIMEGNGLLGRLVSDSSIARSVERTVYSIEQSGGEVAQITHELREATYAINHGDGLVARALHDEQLARSFQGVMDSVEVASSRLSQTSSNLNAFSEKLNNEEGALYKILEDPAVARDVEAIFDNLHEGSTDIDEVLETINNSWLLNLFSRKNKKDAEEHN